MANYLRHYDTIRFDENDRYHTNIECKNVDREAPLGAPFAGLGNTGNNRDRLIFG